MNQPSFDSPVSKTALLSAAARAAESERPDALFVDPWARTLAGREGQAMLDATGSPRPRLALAVRTRFFDDVVRTCAASMRSVVMLASGFDTRPYRLSLSSKLDWFELDHADLLAEKHARLTEARAVVLRGAHIAPVAVDLSGDFFAALEAADFDARSPTLFLAEGLFMYLEREAVEGILARIDQRAASRSIVAFDVPSSLDRSGAMQRHHRELDEAGAGWKFAIERPETLFDPSRWEVTVVHLGHPRAHFGRLSSQATEVRPPGPVTLFVVARRVR